MLPAIRFALCAAAVVVCLVTDLVGARATRGVGTPAFPSDGEIRRILAQRVDALSTGGDGIGIVVGVVGPQGRRVIAYGHMSQGSARAPDGNTVFEIGSVGKTLTALLLADMVRRGEVALADPVARYLPRWNIPSRSGRAITLLDLATHTAALPFMPEQSTAARRVPAAAYTVSDLRRFLAGYELPYDVGTTWEYSNVGYWLLGETLASRAGTEFTRDRKSVV